MGEHGIQRDTPLSHQESERHVKRRRLEEMDPEVLEQFRNDWCLGSEAFRKECLERMDDKLTGNHLGSARLESTTAKAERLIARELARLNWTREDLVSRPKSDLLKLALAARLRRETTLSRKQIAGRLNLGKPKGPRATLTNG